MVEEELRGELILPKSEIDDVEDTTEYLLENSVDRGGKRIVLDVECEVG